MTMTTITQVEGVKAQELAQIIAQEVKNAMAQPQPENIKETLLTRKETAQMLSVSLVTLNNWRKSGVLIPYRIGNKVRYKENEVLNALQAMNPETRKR
uniref:helix-turn-helix domain-containing protein n=1 Tax=Ornithobacterium rhinotracheale TaxID=28251 RepID=UPI0039A72FAA